MKSSVKTLMAVLLASGLFAGGISGAAAELRYRSGVTQCGFNHFSRMGGTEDHTSSVNLRNPNGNVTIKVNRMQMFRADGSLMSEVPASLLPTLGAHQSLTLNTRDYWTLMGLAQEPDEQRPFQLLIEWSVENGRGYHLGANVVRQVRDGGNGAERSRHRGSCRHLELRF